MRDLDILIEAVEAWERKDDAGDMMSELLTSMLVKDSAPAEVAKIKADRAERNRTREQSQRQRKEQSILLRAKLIHMLDERRASAFAAETLSTEAPR